MAGVKSIVDLNCLHNPLPLGRCEMFVDGNIFSYDGSPHHQNRPVQMPQYTRRVLESLAQQVVQKAGITTELCSNLFSVLCTARQITEHGSV